MSPIKSRQEKLDFIDNKVPLGFEPWYKIIERIQNEVYQEVHRLLSKNDVFEAIEIFYEETKYNSEKVLH